MSRNKEKVYPKQSRRVFVAMSGGVDSSVAALLLRDAGYDVTGVFMRCYNLDGCAERDATDARRVAAELNIPFYVFNFEKEYKKRVVEYMIDGYKRGITPNPDVMCNKEIKFGLFLEKALSLGADYVATGHYVQLGYSAPRNGISEPLSLFAAKDKNKDQSYFLWTLTQEQLKHCLFPIGDYLKGEVREMARRAGLPTAEKKDSQGICFLGKVSLHDFLKKRIPSTKGKVLTTTGERIGEHEGAEFYTIGQRHIGIMNYESRIKGRHETKPHYVVEKDVAANTVVVAEGSDNPALYKKELELGGLNFTNPATAGTIRPSALLGTSGANRRMDVLVRVRYRQPLVKAMLYNPSPETYNLKFDQPVKFVAPGQSAVFYSKEGELLGGGVIIK
ncbi:MAG: tRNA 2-thiouridine(34) synthase MnmA [Candidatus Jorgensenbacteria bacterium]